MRSVSLELTTASYVELDNPRGASASAAMSWDGCCAALSARVPGTSRFASIWCFLAVFIHAAGTPWL